MKCCYEYSRGDHKHSLLAPIQQIGTILHSAGNVSRHVWFVLAFASLSVPAQPTRQNPSPMSDTTRPHPRIEKVEAPGRRVELQTLKGARLFAGPKVRASRPVPLIIHFHGAPWLTERHVANHLPRVALITVQLGAGSRAYAQPFERPDLFKSLVAEAERGLSAERGFSSITLTGFSAGYGAIRAILRQEDSADRVNGILLLDGIHAGYSPDGKPLAEGGTIIPADLEPFVRFAREAAAGKRTFVITHSEIFPGTFASTTECVDHVLNELKLRRRPALREGPMGMQQLSAVDVKGFHVRGYAGNSAPDHIDHLHAMPEWLSLMDVK